MPLSSGPANWCSPEVGKITACPCNTPAYSISINLSYTSAPPYQLYFKNSSLFPKKQQKQYNQDAVRCEDVQAAGGSTCNVRKYFAADYGLFPYHENPGSDSLPGRRSIQPAAKKNTLCKLFLAASVFTK
jgi:hypothetical protein